MFSVAIYTFIFYEAPVVHKDLLRMSKALILQEFTTSDFCFSLDQESMCIGTCGVFLAPAELCNHSLIIDLMTDFVVANNCVFSSILFFLARLLEYFCRLLIHVSSVTRCVCCF